MAGVVVGIARPNEAVIGHLVPFLARDLARLAADADGRIGEEADLDVVAARKVVPPLISALNAFADHARSLMRDILLFGFKRRFDFPCRPTTTEISLRPGAPTVVRLFGMQIAGGRLAVRIC